MTRPVREDQHGTQTGYAYGCRCDDCRRANREYGDHVSEETLDRVYAAIEREADLDGLSTAGSNRLAEVAGLSQPHAAMAVRVLANQGRIKILGSVGRGGLQAIQIDGAV